MIPYITLVISNLNHHNSALVRSFLQIFGYSKFSLIVKHDLSAERKAQGWSISINSRLDIRYLESLTTSDIHKFINLPDVVIFDIPDLHYLEQRVKSGKLTFYASERWFKPQFMGLSKSLPVSFIPHFIENNLGYLRFSSPRFLHRFSLLKNLQLFPNFFFLSKGWGGACEFNRLSLFKSRTLVWGYFIENNYSSNFLPLQRAGVLWIGRLLDWKRPDLYIKAVSHLVERYPSVDFLLIGEGPFKNKIQALSTRLGLSSRIKFTNFIPNSEVISLLSKVSLLVVTSNTSEGWGVIVNEAMALKCPIVCSDAVGCVNYLINSNEHAFVFRSGSVTSLTNKITQALSNLSLSEQFAESAHCRIINQWSSDFAAQKISALSSHWLSNGALNARKGSSPGDLTPLIRSSHDVV